MKKVKVKKSDLLASLSANKKKHEDELVKAKEAYIKESRARLIEAVEAIDDSGEVDLNPIRSLTTPVDRIEEYESAIFMAQLSHDDILEIDEQEFREYFEDKWSWRIGAFMANTTYSG